MRYSGLKILLAAIVFMLVNPAPSIAGIPGHGSLECTACHEDNGTRRPEKLGPLGHAVCQECHKDKQGPGHHAIGSTLGRSMKRPADLPLDEDRVVCASCHNPHGSPYKGLLRMTEPQLCTQCHNK